MSKETVKETPLQMALLVLKYAAVVYCILAGLLFVMQRKILYVPAEGPLPTPAAVGLGAMTPVTVKTEDGLELAAWHAAPREEGGLTVVVFHGNAGAIAHRSGIALAMMKRGYGVLLQEYRGYSGNPGRPSEEGLYADGRAALAWLKEKGYGSGRLAYYGESLGTGVAVQMALETPPKYLVLHSPYSSVPDVGQEHYPVFPAYLLLRDRFSSIDKIASIKAPLLIMHGDADTLIPIALAKELFDAANEPKTFIVIEGGGHNDLYVHGGGDKVGGWLEGYETREN